MTDASGAFTLSGVGRGNLIVVAAHERHGRSLPLRLPKSHDSVAGITLELEGYGAIEGSVKDSAGEPIEGVVVMAQSKAAPFSVMMVNSGSDGAFRLDRVAPDVYTVNAAPGSPFAGLQFHSETATVRTGETTRVELTMATGNVSLAVSVTSPDGPVASAMVFVANEAVPPKVTDALALYEAITRRTDGFWSMAMSARGFPATVPKLMPGDYTACAVAYPEQVSGFEVMIDYLLTRGEHLAVICRAVTITDTPEQQTTAIEVSVPEFVPSLEEQADDAD